MKACSLLVLLALVLTGCGTRSISDSSYRPSHGWGHRSNPLYRGELNELDILGLAPAPDATEANITRTLATATQPRLKRGEKIILIQSGALVPDNAMLDAAGRYFSVAPFSGVPPEEKTGLAASLRLRAAQGGYRYLVCYWGVLESAQLDKEGKVLSWVPIAGAFVPDQQQQMRIRLKALLVDVATGNWQMFTPEAKSDTGYNSRFSRESSDQKRVETLKIKGYASLATELAKE